MTMNRNLAVDNSAPFLNASTSSMLGAIGDMLRAELAFYPGRKSLILRIVLPCTLVMLCVMVFRIPGATLGAYFPLFLSRESLRTSKRSALWISTICILGTAEIVLGAMAFAGSPFLHFIWICASLFAVFYLISCLKVYESGLALGLLITNGITTWDQPISADMRLRQTLFTLLAILLGCALSVLIEYVFARTHPPDALLEGIRQRLDLIGSILRSYVNSGADRSKLTTDVNRYVMRGTGGLRELIQQAEHSFEERQRLSTAVALSGRLIDLAATLIETNHLFSGHDLVLCSAIEHNLSSVRTRLLQGQPTDWIALEDSSLATSPIIIEIERTVDLLADSLSRQTWEDVSTDVDSVRAVDQRPRFFASDAFSSREHFRFAIRGGVTAVACYVLYMSVGWNALNASVATCILTAVPVTGAARHRQLMRFAGVILGACALGFGVQAIILPQIDSVLSFTLVFASVIFLGAWVGTSGPRIAYCGAQIVLAYELVNLNHFSISDSLVPARDTVCGIMLGIAAMWLIFDHLWPTYSTQSMRLLLGLTIREIAGLEEEVEGCASESREEYLAMRANAISQHFERLRSLVDVSVFEPFRKRAQEEATLKHTRDLLPQLRAVLLIKTGLLHHRLTTRGFQKNELITEVEQRCSELLLETVYLIEGGTLKRTATRAACDSELHLRLRTAEQPRARDVGRDLTELQLCSSLFSVVSNLPFNDQ